MFLFVLGGSLVLGAGLLAAASYSEGMLVAFRTAALSIGWLLLLATLAGLIGLRRAPFVQSSAAAVTFLSGLAVLYMAYFDSGQVPDAPIGHASAETLPVRVAYDVIAAPTRTKDAPPKAQPRRKESVAALAPPAAAAAGADDVIAAPAPAKAAPPAEQPRRNESVAALAPPAAVVANACASLTGVESLQCTRCSEKLGVAWLVCQEKVRLEYCDGRHADETTCPSAIPATSHLPPG